MKNCDFPVRKLYGTTTVDAPRSMGSPSSILSARLLTCWTGGWGRQLDILISIEKTMENHHVQWVNQL